MRRPLSWMLALALAFGALAVDPAWAGARRLPDHLLGIRLGMTKEEVVKRLAPIGRPTTDRGGPAGAKQFWELSDRCYAWLAVRFDAGRRVVWVTAFARPAGPPVRYRDVGSLEEARKQGAYFYTWQVAGKGDAPAYAVTARGNHPELVSSLSLYRLPDRRN